MAYPIVNIDRMHGTDNMADLRSAKYGSFSGSPAVFTGAGINNGCIAVLSGMIDHEMYYAIAPTSSNVFEDLYLVASPEFLPNPLQQSLDCFTNEANAPIRLFKLQNGDVFSITEDGVSGSSFAVGDEIYFQNGDAQLKKGSGVAQIGSVVAIESKGGKSWLVIEVKYVAE